MDADELGLLSGRLATELGAQLDERLAGIAPAHAWGVFAGGELVRVHGSGNAAERPASTAFRIASCTKSFTAAATLLLAEEGSLDLDEPLADALDVPLTLIGPAGPPPTVRDALAMRAGFPTDDPWADRQESLSDDDFGRLLTRGVRLARPAGSGYEYSNLGYAIVGRILALRAGMPYLRLVETRLLGPLGLTGTGFDRAVPHPITGYRPGPDGWEALPFSAPGAFSPIGGLFSTVTDLARWCGVLSGAIDTEALPHGLVERMRHPQTPVLGDVAGSGPWQAYGLGLVVRADGAGRHFIGHSGGYPGFTTRMEWEQSSRVGAVVFENATYTSLTPVVHAAFAAAFGSPDAAPAAPLRPAVVPWPEAVAAAERLRTALAAGSLGEAALLDPCVDLDVPLERRRARLAELLTAIGGVIELGAIEHETPAQAAWELHGPRGVLRCRILLTPVAEPRVQKLDVTLG
ncbi:MAG: serine hydrolase domain-containing protein [Protaetiibacter sp.]